MADDFPGIPTPRLPDIVGALEEGAKDLVDGANDAANAFDENVNQPLESALLSAGEAFQNAHESYVDFAESPLLYTDYGNPADAYINDRVSDAHGATPREIIVGELNAWGTLAAVETGKPWLFMLGSSLDALFTGGEVIWDVQHFDFRGAVHAVLHWEGRALGSIVGGAPAISSSAVGIETLKAGGAPATAYPTASSLVQMGPATVGGTKVGGEVADQASDAFDHWYDLAVGAVGTGIDAAGNGIKDLFRFAADHPESLIQDLGVAADAGGSGGMDFGGGRSSGSWDDTGPSGGTEWPSDPPPPEAAPSNPDPEGLLPLNAAAADAPPEPAPVDTDTHASPGLQVWSEPPAPEPAPANPDPEGLLPLNAAAADAPPEPAPVDTDTHASPDLQVWSELPAPEPAPVNPDPEGLLPLNAAAADAPPEPAPVDTDTHASLGLQVWSEPPAPQPAPANPDPEGLLPLNAVDTSTDASFDFSVLPDPVPPAPSNPDPVGFLPPQDPVDTSTDASFEFSVLPDPAPPAPSNPDPEGLLPLNATASHAPPPSATNVDFFW